MSRKTRSSLILLLTAIIWGAAFVAQSEAMNYIGPFAYTMLRSVLAVIILVPVYLIFGKEKNSCTASPAETKTAQGLALKAGISSGIFLASATLFQQFGLVTTSAGKAGFITAIYIVIVPLLGIFTGRRISRLIWISVLVAVTGFYLLCIKEDFSLERGDFLVLCCAFLFSFQIIIIDHFTSLGVNPVKMSLIQFITVMIFCAVPTFLFEKLTPQMIWDARWTIAYAGFMSSGVAYTLQIIGQRDADPAVATLIMSLESVFSALFGWLLLHERMSFKELAGCALVFAAVLLAQTDPSDQKKHTQNN